MATYFQSFRSSSMPKRLLRYVMSKLDLLEAEALDLENLDLAFGKNTVLEFRDVGIQIQKLEKLLQLPPTFKIQKAKVLLLRVTIPVDFYTSPITAEIDGVDVRLKVLSKPETEGRSRRKGKSKDESAVVPSPADLAQSFLEAQPSSEKRQLEEAIAAETQDLGASVAVSDSGSDDDGLAYGTGQGLSLPAFLTDFLQAVIDRIQVVICGVKFQLDVELPVDATAGSPEVVTFELAVEGVNVEGVTTATLDEDQTPKIAPKDGKRHIALENIRGFLISEANVFSTLARSPSMPSSLASQSPVLTDHQRAYSRQPTAMDLAMTSGTASISSDHSISDSEMLAQNRYPLQDSEDVFNIPYDFSSQGAVDDALPEEPPSALSTPRASIYQDFAPGLVHQDYSRSEIMQTESAPWRSVSREAQSEPSLHHIDETRLPQPRTPSPGPEPERDSLFDESTAAGDDLAQSHLYSHEDAESMYMSAFSAANSTQFRSNMPGAWDAEHSPSPEHKRVVTPPAAEEQSTAPAGAPEASGTDSPKSDIAQSFASLAVEEVPTEPNPELAETVSAAEKEEDTARPDVPQDDVRTPRGGHTRLVKEILSLASVSVYMPSNHKHIHVESHQLGKSVSPHLPGAFSVHSTASTIPTPPSQPVASDDNPVDKALEANLAPLEIRFDASIGFLLAKVVSKLVEAFKGRPEASTTQIPGGKSPSKPGADLRITAESISLLFLEKLAGVSDTVERVLAHQPAMFAADVLLKADIKNLTASTMAAGSQRTETTVNIEKFAFGYANEPIIAFDRSVNMFESVMNTFPAAGNEISVKLSQSADDMRCNVDTLPLHVNLDLQRLDETFSWFGGLSSFLSMGSSMTSSATGPGGASKSPARGTQKRRGVRFDAPINPNDQSAAKENKVAMRINGFRLDLIGKDCSVVLDTSAVKFVSREEAIGVHISRSRLSGPYLRNSGGDPPIVADVLNTRLEFLNAPRNTDLERLLELITPSKVKFDENDDEIMVDTLLRQRRKGAVLRVTLDKIKVAVSKVQQLDCLPALGEELARLGTVAKYLPEDDRPGLLTLALVKNVDLSLDIGGRFGAVNASMRDVDLGLITLPYLAAVSVNTLTVDRNQIEELVHTSKVQKGAPSQSPPVLMMRMVDSIEPVIKVRLTGLNVEYRVPTIMDVLGLAADATPQDFEAGLAASVANLGDHAHSALKGKRAAGQVQSREPRADVARPIHVDLTFRDCLVGLNPLGLTSKLIVVLTDAHLDVSPPKDDKIGIVANLRKTSVLLIDDISLLDSEATVASRRRPSDASSPQVVQLCSKGFVDICQISSAKATVRISKGKDGEQHVDIGVRDDLLVIETCADSTQTLITLANALKPPTPPSKEVRYKTSVVPVNDLLASLTSDAFGKAEGDYDFDNDFGMAQELASETEGDDDFYGGGVSSDSPLQLDSQYYEQSGSNEEIFDAAALSMTSDRTTAQDTADGVLLTSLSTHDIADDSSDDLNVQENYFGTASVFDGTAHRWNSAKNTYDRSNDRKVLKSPVKVCIRDVHVIWNLFDGYDWLRTRDVITKAVKEVETKAYERRSRADRRAAFEQDFEEEETVIGDFLFNSIYIGIPANRDPAELARAINQELNDNATETESVATTALTVTPSRAGASRPKPKKLKLGRSRHHKITFELKGVNVDLITFPPGSGETQSSVDVRVRDLDIFDHVPTSTWKKFAMYDQDAGGREMGSSMVHLEILNVQPVPSLPASEIVLKATILPLRLHVDQDALDFITRFFEFKDDSAPVHASSSDVPFIQRAEVNSVPVKLDFKPKRVDYAGLRSGHTTEFMNFLILEDARMVLRHTIIYGVSGFDRLGKTLNDIWMPEIKRNQLPGILAGLAPVRGIVNVGSGVRDLIEIPIKEYKKDGRIVRSIGKGAAAFARTTGTEIVKLGAKLAIGTQYVLQGAEGMLVNDPADAGGGASSSAGGAGGAAADWDDEEEDYADGREKKQISLYADQPTGVIQGLRGAYSSLSRDLYMARDAIIAVPGEVMESQSAQGAAKAVLKRAPTIIFRPAIGATKALGQTLLGATNTLDPEHRRRMDAKYKKH
ncbi:Autophagy-related protein 2 [Coniochaeta hoffmannii]|uniref:Autophagy-related protein 2 n=1 Tax=Coniochaeta hoffmannii TaxID=91930 RepID=A0AA38VIV5_9PEZI|nr:Autophagy-related protein 2 [Coniochaeta hoffmannii]